jgi:hypothetical protein
MSKTGDTKETKMNNWKQFTASQTARVLGKTQQFVVLNADGRPHGPSFRSEFPALAMAKSIGGSVLDRKAGEVLQAALDDAVTLRIGPDHP